jgi:hypothetical protein
MIVLIICISYAYYMHIICTLYVHTVDSLVDNALLARLQAVQLLVNPDLHLGRDIARCLQMVPNYSQNVH